MPVVAEFARTGPRLQPGQQLRHVLRRHAGMHRDDEGLVAEQRQGGEIRQRVEAEIGIERGHDRMRRARQQQRVAVRRRAGDGAGADGGAGAGQVLDHHGLAEPPRHRLRQDAGDDVDDAACGEGHHDADGRAGKSCARARMARRAR